MQLGTEDQLVTVPPRSVVRYGASPYDRYVERLVTGAFVATNSFFGSDPAPYADKFVYLSLLPTPAAGSTEIVETWTSMGIEPQTVTIPPNSTVRYGVTPFDRYIESKASGALTLGSTTFGRDPAPGAYKRLFLQGSAPAVSPPTTTATVLPPTESMRYKVLELGLEPDANGVDAKAIGPGGEVVGNAVVLAPRGLSTTRAFLWRPGQGYFPLTNTYLGSQARRVDRHLRIVGLNINAGSTGPVIWEGSGMPVALGQRYGDTSWSFPEDANSNGLVVGWSQSSYSSNREPFLWTRAAGYGYIGTLSSLPNCIATSVNEQAQIVGTCSDPTYSGVQSAFIWDPVGRIRDLGQQLGLPNSAALKINSAGVVLGRYSGGHFIWDPRATSGGRTGITVLPASFTPNTIDNSGRVWGRESAEGRLNASVWTNGVLFNLNALIDPFDPTRARLYFVDALGADLEGRILVTHGSLGSAYSYRAAVLVPMR
jgi:hypothetical protein